MNGIATFRLCKLSNDELIKKVDSGTDEMYQTGKIPTRNIPARPDEDYDLLVGEMIYRFGEQSARIRQLEGELQLVTSPQPEREKFYRERIQDLRESLGAIVEAGRMCDNSRIQWIVEIASEALKEQSDGSVIRRES